MRPDEWRQGIMNEIEHVEDAAWAVEARRYANRGVWRERFFNAALALVLLETLVLVSCLHLLSDHRRSTFEYGWVPDPTVTLAWNWVPALVALALLARLKLSPGLTGLLFVGGVPVLFWLTGVLWPVPSDPFPGSYLHAQDFFPRLILQDVFAPTWPNVVALGELFLIGVGMAWLGQRFWAMLDRGWRRVVA